MAARKHLSHDAKTRERIRTSQLINRLQSNAFGKIELTPSQLKAIEILLRKSLPDLSAIQLSGDQDNPVQQRVLLEFVKTNASGQDKAS